MPPNQMNEEGESGPAPPKVDNTVRNIIIALIVLVLIGGIIYAYVVIKYPYLFANVGNETAIYVNGTAISPAEQQKIDNAYKLLIGLALFGLVGIILYLIFFNKRKPKGLRDPVPVDRAIDLFKQHFCLNNQIECVFDAHKGKMVYVPTKPTSIIVNDKLPYFHSATGDNFLLLEIEVREGLQQGLHSIIIPIDKGEEPIKTGYYRIDTHTPRFQFNLNKINFPMSSITDKRERMQMAMLESMEEGNIPSSMRESFYKAQMQQYPGSYINTPLDQAEAEGGIPPSPQPYYPRRQPYRRRYYRR